MPFKIPNDGVTITVRSDNGHLVPIELNDHVLRNCPVINAMPSGTILPNVQVKPFQAVTSYLDGDNLPSVFANRVDSIAPLLLFAQTWALAARLGLPILQNELISVMTDVHARVINGSGTDSHWQNTADRSLVKAFLHLREQVGANSHAEKFLICFVGKTAPFISELEQNLTREHLDPAIRNEILEKARSFGQDPIKHQPQMFRINPQQPPKYRPLEQDCNDTGMADGFWSPSGSSRSITRDDMWNMPPQHPRSPKFMYPRPRSPLSNRFDHGSGPLVCTQPGDPSDPDPGYTSQAVNFDDRNLPTGAGVNVIRLTGQGPGGPRSLPSPANHHHDTTLPYIIQITQHNDNAHGNGNHTHYGDKHSTTAHAQGGSSGGSNRTVRAVADSGERRYKLIRERKGKQSKWFSLLAYGSKYY
ncbi:uncharacterized protein J4E84_005311 [Alternaria hordeiaustralica]|uniref:uncharacterized protein n=1 Tax=Alternaria hordeiaustralica TaxID=1187925 RepID=UPI0020C1F399|nr:uncharacterized protein J4E84_005311 [Alternaria hordeiaustralica]KAI4686940.1 hypothetical protein J4E84_005311 [Alternaria hordeiaustralica]